MNRNHQRLEDVCQVYGEGNLSEGQQATAKSPRGLYLRMFGQWLAIPQRKTKGSLRNLRKGQAVELRVADSNQVGATLRAVVDVRAVGHQAVGSNRAVVDHQVANRLVHRLHRMVQRKHLGILDKDDLVRPILGGEIETDRITSHL